MPATAELSEPEQDEILVRIYALAQYHAAKRVRSGYREDMVQNLALEWLERLRAGTRDVKREAWNEFVITEIRNHKTADRRKRQREMARDAIHLENITNAKREWMSPKLNLEEKELREFADGVRDTLPRKCVRAHRMLRDDEMSYAEVGKRLREPVRRVHGYIATVHRAFRNALPAVDITPPESKRGGRPARVRGQVAGSPPQRRRRGDFRGREPYVRRRIR